MLHARQQELTDSRRSPFHTQQPPEHLATHRPVPARGASMEDSAHQPDLDLACAKLGQAEQPALARQVSAPCELPPEPPIGVLTSGLDWSGDVEGPKLIYLAVHRDLQARCGPDSADLPAFPPPELAQQAASIALGRPSEESSGALSAGLWGSSQMADSTRAQAGTPMLSKNPSLGPGESPFEAPAFQDDPIARPAALPALLPAELARPAATAPPAGLAAALSPHSPRSPASAPLAQRQALARTTGGGGGGGVKSLSAVDVAGMSAAAPSPQRRGGSASPRERYCQRVVAEGMQMLAADLSAPPAPALAAFGAGHRSATCPAADFHAQLDAAQQAQAQLPSLRSRDSGLESSMESEDLEDMMAAASLRRAISRFQPAEEPARSPTRAPSLGDLSPAAAAESAAAEWAIPSSELELGRRIGSGSFGEVFRAQWRHTDVAVKRLTSAHEALAEDDFRKEIQLMARLKHPNIVQFLGCCLDSPTPAIVTQFMPRGSLFNLLHRARVPLEERQRLWLALDCARGLHYLHSCSPPIVHGDVSSKNMLVDRDFSVRVSDFGMSRQRRKAMLSAAGGGGLGTAEWTAPEVLRGQPYRESCDVWAFGVILYELMTGQVPWAELSTIQVVGAVGWGNASLHVPESVQPPTRALMARCMQREPEARPSFGEIIVALREIRAALPPPAPPAPAPPPAASAPPPAAAAAVAATPAGPATPAVPSGRPRAEIESRRTL